MVNNWRRYRNLLMKILKILKILKIQITTKNIKLRIQECSILDEMKNSRMVNPWWNTSNLFRNVDYFFPLSLSASEPEPLLPPPSPNRYCLGILCRSVTFNMIWRVSSCIVTDTNCHILIQSGGGAMAKNGEFFYGEFCFFIDHFRHFAIFRHWHPPSYCIDLKRHKCLLLPLKAKISSCIYSDNLYIYEPSWWSLQIDLQPQLRVRVTIPEHIFNKLMCQH